MVSAYLSAHHVLALRGRVDDLAGRIRFCSSFLPPSSMPDTPPGFDPVWAPEASYEDLVFCGEIFILKGQLHPCIKGCYLSRYGNIPQGTDSPVITHHCLYV